MSSSSITPVNPQTPPPAAPAPWQKAKSALGFVWKTLGLIPHGIMTLIAKIKNLASGIFSSSKPNSQPPSLQSKTITPAEKPPVSNADSNGQDPFKNMGAVRPPENPLPIANDQVGPIEKKGVELINQGQPTASELIQRAQEMIQREDNPVHIQEFVGRIDALNQVFEQLKRYASTFRESSLKDHELVQKTLADLERKMGEWEREICIQVAHHYAPNPHIPGDGNCMFWSISNLDGKGYSQKYYRQKAADYLRLHAAQNDELMTGILDVMGLQNKVEKYAEEQGGRERWKANVKQKLSLEREPTNDELYRDLLLNKPSSKPQTIEDKMKLYAERQGEMEKWKAKVIAQLPLGATLTEDEFYADFLLNNPQMEEEKIEKIDEYAAARGGWAKWMAELKEKDPLKQEPTVVDLYCDFLVNSSREENGKEKGQPLWGGVIELMALSQQLKVPILIFQPLNNPSKWQFYAKLGTEFADREPMLLYYSGGNHYQSLIPNS
jgi:hypothetical protein